MLRKKQTLFIHPETQALKFDSIFERIGGQPLVAQKDGYRIEASCSNTQKLVNLAVHASVLQKGSGHAPIVLYVPWFGGKSARSQKFFDSKRHPDWTYIGIDIFSPKEQFNNILASALVSQYSYALVLRMMAEQVRLAHEAERRVGVVGISYGANVLGAYITRKLELPDAVVAVEGGSILQITLQVKYRGHDSDPQTLRALELEPDLLPLQVPVAGKAAYLSAAVINPDDKMVIGQEEFWTHAVRKLYIHGTHITAPLLNRRKILRLTDSHLEKLLLP